MQSPRCDARSFVEDPRNLPGQLFVFLFAVCAFLEASGLLCLLPVPLFRFLLFLLLPLSRLCGI
jgi:hypothetical protein